MHLWHILACVVGQIPTLRIRCPLAHCTLLQSAQVFQAKGKDIRIAISRVTRVHIGFSWPWCDRLLDSCEHDLRYALAIV